MSTKAYDGIPGALGPTTPPLENGDRLTRLEFERRYTAMPDLHKEYVVWRVYDRQLDWFALEAGRYTRIPPDADGMLESRTFPGLRLCVPALLAGDLARVLAELQAGLALEAHAAFLRRLA